MFNMPSFFKVGLNDMIYSLRNIRQSAALALFDVKVRYARSILGPFWTTINTLILSFCLAIVFGTIFLIPVGNHLIHLTSGLIIWQYFTNTMSEAAQEYVNSKSYIDEFNNPIGSYILQCIARNTIDFGHNILALVIIIILFSDNFDFFYLTSVLGVIVLLPLLTSVSLLLAALGARFTDVSMLLNSVFTALFYATPIIWSETQIPNETALALAKLNPFYHVLSLIREPITAKVFPLYSLMIILIITMIMVPVSLYVHGYYKNKISYMV